MNKGVLMKLLVLAFVMLSFGIAHANDPAAATTAAPAVAADPNHPKDNHKAIHTELKDERDAVVTACSEESKAANCGDKVVGKGLLKCIGEHKKASKEFKVSEGCKSAMKGLKSERSKLKGM